jgi:NAD(P)-dependent dehydrogenase (short-subunit alcohol dehydrogenase family)
VTGASAGLGKLLTRILYQHNAKVYLAARSENKTAIVIEEIEAAFPESKGELIFLKLQLDDLSTIKASAEEFLAKESRLDVLWLNAGVMVPAQGSKTKQGYELQLGVNNLGHFFFASLLRDTLAATAKVAPTASVRVIWVSSSAADAAPKPAIDFDNMDYHNEEGIWTKYARSKAGSVLHSLEFTRRTEGTGVVSLVSFFVTLGLHLKY